MSVEKLLYVFSISNYVDRSIISGNVTNNFRFKTDIKLE